MVTDKEKSRQEIENKEEEAQKKAREWEKERLQDKLDLDLLEDFELD